MKKLIAAAAVAALALSACGGNGDSSDGANEALNTPNADGLIEVRVGASPTPHAVLLEFLENSNLAADAGITITVTEFTDYVLPNETLAKGDIDANYFQHIPYFDQQVADQEFDFARSEGIHIEPFGAYSETLASLDELPEGARVSIPNDPSNGGRALLLLADYGVITLAADVESPTVLDIEENPKNIEIVELEAAILPTTLPDVAAAVINGNYALEAGLVPANDSIALENPEDNPYVNIVAFRTADQDTEGIKTLIELLTSEEVREFISTTWPDGELIPAF